MKKIFAVLLTVVMMMSMFSMAAMACDEGARGVYFSGMSNVRTGPGLSYSSIGQVNAGSTLNYLHDVTYDERGVAWYRVSFGSGSGWVSSRYSSLTGSVGSATYAAGGGDNYSAGSYVSSGVGGSTVYATGNTNVRTGPGLSYTEAGCMEQGDYASFLGNSSMDNRGITWYNVSFGGVTGWVSSVYTLVY